MVGYDLRGARRVCLGEERVYSVAGGMTVVVHYNNRLGYS